MIQYRKEKRKHHMKKNDNEKPSMNHSTNKRPLEQEEAPKKYSIFLKYEDDDSINIRVSTEYDEINVSTMNSILFFKKTYKAIGILIVLSQEIPFPFRGVYKEDTTQLNETITQYYRQNRIIDVKTALQWKLLFMLIAYRWKQSKIRNIPRFIAIYITKFITNDMIVSYYNENTK